MDSTLVGGASNWASLSGKPTTLSGYGITDAQSQSLDLTAIAGLVGTTGLLKKTAANTWSLDATQYLAPDVNGDLVANIVPRTETLNNLLSTIGTTGELASATDINAIVKYTGVVSGGDVFLSGINGTTPLPKTIPYSSLLLVINPTTTSISEGKGLFVNVNNTSLTYSENGRYWRLCDAVPTSTQSATDGTNIVVMSSAATTVATTVATKLVPPYNTANQTTITLSSDQYNRPVATSAGFYFSSVTGTNASVEGVAYNLPSANWCGGKPLFFNNGIFSLEGVIQVKTSSSLVTLLQIVDGIVTTRVSVTALPSAVATAEIFVAGEYVYISGIGVIYYAKVAGILSSPTSVTWGIHAFTALAGKAASNLALYVSDNGDRLVGIVGPIKSIWERPISAIVSATDSGVVTSDVVGSIILDPFTKTEASAITLLSSNPYAVGNLVIASSTIWAANGVLPQKPEKSVTSTATTGTIALAKDATFLHLNPATLAATLTIQLPLSPYVGQEVTIAAGGTIATGSTVVTTLTLSPSATPAAQTIIGGVTTLVSGTPVKYRYTTTKIWMRV